MGILFGTDGVRDKANQGSMTVETALKLGRAVAVYFRDGHADDEVRPTIVIGRDPRLSGPMLEAALTAGICSAGVDVRLLGVVPTPAVAQIAIQTGAAAGLVVSASHNPYYDNGIKVFKGTGFKLSDEEEGRIEDLFSTEAVDLPTDADVGTVFSMENASEVYAGFCVDVLPGDRPLDGLKLILDCSNGATSSCAGPIFESLGATVETIHNEPDGININDRCGSQHTQDLSAKVLESAADAGLAFDGDGDRLIVVDEQGEVLTGDQIMAICAKACKERGALSGNRVVATVMSNIGFHAAMKALGINGYGRRGRSQGAGTHAAERCGARRRGLGAYDLSGLPYHRRRDCFRTQAHAGTEGIAREIVRARKGNDALSAKTDQCRRAAQTADG